MFSGHSTTHLLSRVKYKVGVCKIVQFSKQYEIPTSVSYILSFLPHCWTHSLVLYFILFGSVQFEIGMQTYVLGICT